MKLPRILASLGLAVALTACAAAPQQGPSGLDKLADFTLEDLRVANALAERTDDRLAAHCYTGLIEIVQDMQLADEAAVEQAPVGAFSAFQTARNARRTVGDVLSGTDRRDDLRMACAPLLSDERSLVVKLITLGKLR